MDEQKKESRRIKTQATKEEFARVYDNMNLPGRDIVVELDDGIWIREFWSCIGRFGWTSWKRANW